MLLQLRNRAIEHIFAIVVILVEDAPFFQPFFLDHVVHRHCGHMPVIRANLEHIRAILFIVTPFVCASGWGDQRDLVAHDGLNRRRHRRGPHTGQQGKDLITLDQALVIGDRTWGLIAIIEDHVSDFPPVHTALIVDVVEIRLGPNAGHAVTPHGDRSG